MRGYRTLAVASYEPLYCQDNYMAGFWLVNAESMQLAQDLATEGSKACNRKVEVRPLLG